MNIKFHLASRHKTLWKIANAKCMFDQRISNAEKSGPHLHLIFFDGSQHAVSLSALKVVLAICWIITCVLAFMIGLKCPKDLDVLCTDHMDLHCLHYHDVDFNAKLTRGNIYRDNAWRELGMNVPAPFMVTLRRPIQDTTWYNYDYYCGLGEHEFENSPKILQMHVGHCLDFLRQQLMCTADIGLVPFVWVEGQPEPGADFSTKHRRKDFDAIRQWAKEKQVDEQQAKVKPVRRPGNRVEGYP
ncbi:uncharacterized protein PAC_07043 [Phialocephala subalpina]|uniref:Uncharacterized protein n=1 Tax=Phialocephala subalpina TaxID=576137 RepID=A0A1L7WWK0_9HELO|nr:uncharacterized protein PAC_07043 [Phialocephala subalpina]